MRHTLILLAALLSLVACSDGKLSPSQAHDLVEAALQDSPMYETAHLTLGEVKYRTKKDGDKIKQIKQLESDDYLSIEELKVKKKWLSNDSEYQVYRQGAPLCYRTKRDPCQGKNPRICTLQ